MFHITAFALMEAMETIFYEPTAWCTSITKDWIVKNLDFKVISASDENGRICIMKDDQILNTGFWYEGKYKSSSFN